MGSIFSKKQEKCSVMRAWFAEWLDGELKSFMTLNTAICNHADRAEYLSCYNSYEPITNRFKSVYIVEVAKSDIRFRSLDNLHNLTVCVLNLLSIHEKDLRMIVNQNKLLEVLQIGGKFESRCQKTMTTCRVTDKLLYLVQECHQLIVCEVHVTDLKLSVKAIEYVLAFCKRLRFFRLVEAFEVKMSYHPDGITHYHHLSVINMNFTAFGELNGVALLSGMSLQMGPVLTEAEWTRILYRCNTLTSICIRDVPITNVFFDALFYNKVRDLKNLHLHQCGNYYAAIDITILFAKFQFLKRVQVTGNNRIWAGKFVHPPLHAEDTRCDLNTVLGTTVTLNSKKRSFICKCFVY
jgi:hypothetical protein